MKRIGLMGGSFDPVHAGHMAVARAVAHAPGIDGVWMVLSPQNPLKHGRALTDEALRMAMLRLAVEAEGDPRITASDAELHMPRPSYTIDTLRRLSERHPDIRFSWVMGSDSLDNLGRWRESDEILGRYGVIVYPRPGHPLPEVLPDGVTAVDAPQVDISSTAIRATLADGISPGSMLPAGVEDFIRAHNLYDSNKLT